MGEEYLSNNVTNSSGKVWNKEYIMNIIDKMTGEQTRILLYEMVFNESSLLGAISKALYGHYRAFE